MFLESRWVCSIGCNQKKKDNVLQYSKAILFDGLRNLCRRDAIRENDGPAMLSDWKRYSPEFHTGRHWKYAILSHTILAGKSGRPNGELLPFYALPYGISL